MKNLYFLSTVLLVMTLAACTQNTPETPSAENSTENMQTENQNSTNNSDQKVNIMKKATIETNMGNITIEFYPTDAPKTVENFQKLASSGFYNNVVFHRVIKGFMIQGGDPTGTGTGGPGYKFNDEINKTSDLYKTGYKKGVVAMANAGPNTNGSQFFIMHADYPLPPSYTIFGRVVEGLDVVDKIANSPTDPSDKPVTAVTMKSVKLSD